MCYLFLEQSYIGSFLLSSNTIFLKGLHTRLLPPLGSNHRSAHDLQLLSPAPSHQAFSFLTGWAKIKKIKIIHERKWVSAAAANAHVSNPSRQLK